MTVTLDMQSKWQYWIINDWGPNHNESLLLGLSYLLVGGRNMGNIAEEYAALYFRLNGFFTISNFTHLDKSGKNNTIQESDLLGIRCANSSENVKGHDLPIDDDLFSKCDLNKAEDIAILCEVKGNCKKPVLDNKKKEYAKSFFGDLGKDIVFVGVSRKYKSIEKNSAGEITIGLEYIVSKTKEIIEKRCEKYEKTSSWYFGEGLIQTLIFEERISGDK